MAPSGLAPRTHDGVRLAMALLSACAFYATWGVSLRDSTMARILTVRAAAVPRIPGSDQPLRLRFTGFAPLDYWFTIMVLFFWEALDGSHPATSLTGIYFLGQLVAIWTLVWVEGSRAGNRGLAVSRSILWAVLMQNFTLACFGPIFFALHLATSPTARPSPTAEARRASVLPAAPALRLLPLAVLLGYIVPSVVLALPAPGLVSYAAQQAAIAVWTPFPVWVGLAQVVLTWCVAGLAPSASRPASEAQHEGGVRAVRAVYVFALVGSAAVHVGVVAVSASTVLFPAIFSPPYVADFAPANLLFPKNAAVPSIGAGVLNFMQWDQWIGYTAVLLWALALRHADEAVSLRTWTQGALRAVLASVVVGPGGAAAWLIWMRDEKAFASAPVAGRKQSSSS